MAVYVAPGTVNRIFENHGVLTLQVQRPSDPEAAAIALQEAGESFYGLDASLVSNVAHTPVGPFIQVKCKWVSEDDLQSLPHIVVRHLEDAGVADAVVAVALTGGVLGMGLPDMDRAVVARIYPLPRDR